MATPIPPPNARYGPNTAAVEALLEQSWQLTDDSLDALGTAYELMYWSDPGHRLLRMPRDYAWNQLHTALQTHRLVDTFNILWRDLCKDPLSGTGAGSVIRDAACATFMGSYCDLGPYRTLDHDTLLVPWRSVVERCVRSRVALKMIASWPRPADDLWPVIDAVLATPDRPRPGDL